MVKPIRTAILHMSTGVDGETVDPARVLWILGTLVFYGGCIVLICQGKWNMMDYGIGLAAVLGGGAFGVKVKESSEPKVSA